MMKFMKRSLSLLISAMLLLGCFALAEENLAGEVDTLPRYGALGGDLVESDDRRGH